MSRMKAVAPVAVMILVALALAWAALRPLAVVAVDAPATTFSAARAMTVVRMVSASPHPSGSPEADGVRRAIGTRLRQIGLQVHSLRGVGAGLSSGKDPSAQAGDVETLVAVLPGRDRRLPAIAIMAHTDSVPGSFGAADDGFGVGVALETARAIAAGGRPARDVVLVLTDGEEAGLLGARLFFAEPARTRAIGGILNVDSRGTSGLGTMFETGPGSGGLVARYRAVSTHRFAHSAATFLYRRLPNRTDLTATSGFDIPALNFAFLDGEFDYHTPRDAPASVDPRTLQSLGDQVLPVVRAIADDPRPIARGADGVFADAAPIVGLRYPAWVGWPLLALAAGLVVVGASGVGVMSASRAAVGCIAAGLVAMTAARLGYALTGVGDDWAAHHRIMAAFGRYELALSLTAAACLFGTAAMLHRGARRGWVPVACLLAGAIAILLGQPPVGTLVLAAVAAVAAGCAFGRPIPRRDVHAGTVVLALVLSLVVQALAPALTPLFLWPTLAAAGGLVAMRHCAWGRTIAALLGVLPLGYLLVFGHSVLLALGITTPEAIGIFLVLAAPITLPLAGEVGLVVAGAGLVTAAVLLLSFRVSAASERYPHLSQIYGVADADGRSWLVSPLERPDRWTENVLRRGGGSPLRATMPSIAKESVWRVATRPFAVPRPSIDTVRDGERATMTISPASGGRTIAIRLATNRGLRGVNVGGRAMPGFADRAGTFRLRWQSSGTSVVLRFRATAGTRVSVEAAETTERRVVLPDRPVDTVAWLGSDRVIAIARSAITF